MCGKSEDRAPLVSNPQPRASKKIPNPNPKPGPETGHIARQSPGHIDILEIDIDPEELARMEEKAEQMQEPRGKPWNKSEIAKMRFYPKLGVKGLLEFLPGRSRSAIEHRARCQGLRMEGYDA